MRRLVLLAMLASACDQGANAAPPPAQAPLQLVQQPPPPTVEPFRVRDAADFTAKAIVMLDELGAIFSDGSTDCELVATRIENWGAQNVTRFAVLTAYGKAHPEAEQALTKQFEPQLQKLTKTLMPTLTACSSNARLTGAFMKINQQAQQTQQRAR